MVVQKEKKIAIGCDHAGYDLKNFLLSHCKSYQQTIVNIIDCGTFSDKSCDYPDYAKKVVLAIDSDSEIFGVLICGSGIGMSISANRFKNIRAALCYTVETAVLARSHNNANVLCLGSRFTTNDVAIKMLEAFISTDFAGGRHQNRIDKIS